MKNYKQSVKKGVMDDISKDIKEALDRKFQKVKMRHKFEYSTNHPFNQPSTGVDNDYMNISTFPEGHTCLCGKIKYENPDAPHRRVTHPPYSEMFKKIH